MHPPISEVLSLRVEFFDILFLSFLVGLDFDVTVCKFAVEWIPPG
jgi:hypothetical protein